MSTMSTHIMLAGVCASLLVTACLGGYTTTGGQCGSNGLTCPNGQCCSQYNFCGVTSDHCGSGCQSSYGACAGSTPAPAPAPAPAPTSSGMPDVLGQTNYYRAKHHVAPLSWDSSLAASAQAWANTCSYKHSGDAGVGENIAWGNWASFTAVVDGWYNEVSQYNFGNGGFSAATGHFTQLVWAGTTSVGCAVANCPQTFYVCQYSPPGNFLGQFQQNVFAA